LTIDPDVVHRDIDVGNELTLHIAEYGSGPPLVLLHGFTGSTETWTPFRATFAAANRVIAVDQPGHGRSTSPANADRYRLDRLATDLRMVLDSLDIDRAVVLGYSMGGRAALRFAVDHHDRIAGLILESASAGISDERQRNERRASDAAVAGKIEREGIEEFVKSWETLSLWDTQKALPLSVRTELHRQRLLNSPTGLANSLRGAGTGEDATMPQAVASISTPTLIIAGALDSKYVALGESLRRSIAGSRLEIIADAGHTAHLEQPQAFASVIVDFLRTIPSDGNHWT
jgi:2-succinyl-6-hydroxy-2,4-cyclohexadiene-1-carboxylate synthase